MLNGFEARGLLADPLAALPASLVQATAAVTSAPAAVVQQAATRRAYRGTLMVRMRTAEELAAARKAEKEERERAAAAAAGPAPMAVDAPRSFAQAAGRS